MLAMEHGSTLDPHAEEASELMSIFQAEIFQNCHAIKIGGSVDSKNVWNQLSCDEACLKTVAPLVTQSQQPWDRFSSLLSQSYNNTGWKSLLGQCTTRMIGRTFDNTAKYSGSTHEEKISNCAVRHTKANKTICAVDISSHLTTHRAGEVTNIHSQSSSPSIDAMAACFETINTHACVNIVGCVWDSDHCSPSINDALWFAFAAAAEDNVFFDPTLDPLAQIISISDGCANNRIAASCTTEAACDWQHRDSRCVISEKVASYLLRRPSCSPAWEKASACRMIRSANECTGGCIWSLAMHSCMLSASVYFDGIVATSDVEYFDEGLCMDDAWGILSTVNITCSDIVQVFPCHMQLSDVFPNAIPRGIVVHNICPMSCGYCGGFSRCSADEDLKVDLTFTYLNPTLTGPRQSGQLESVAGKLWSCKSVTQESVLQGLGGCSSIVAPNQAMSSSARSSVVMYELCPTACGRCNSTENHMRSNLTAASMLISPALKIAIECGRNSELQCVQFCEWDSERQRCYPLLSHILISVIGPLTSSPTGQTMLSVLDQSIFCRNLSNAACEEQAEYAEVDPNHTAITTMSSADQRTHSTEGGTFRITYTELTVIGAVVLLAVAASAASGMAFMQQSMKRKFDKSNNEDLQPALRQRLCEHGQPNDEDSWWDGNSEPFCDLSSVSSHDMDGLSSELRLNAKPSTVTTGGANGLRCGQCSVLTDAKTNGECADAFNDLSSSTSDSDTSSSDMNMCSLGFEAYGISSYAPDLCNTYEESSSKTWINSQDAGSEINSPDPWGALYAQAAASSIDSSSSNASDEDDLFNSVDKTEVCSKKDPSAATPENSCNVPMLDRYVIPPEPREPPVMQFSEPPSEQATPSEVVHHASSTPPIEHYSARILRVPATVNAGTEVSFATGESNVIQPTCKILTHEKASTNVNTALSASTAVEPVKVAYEPRKRHLSRKMQEQLSGTIVLLAQLSTFPILQLASSDLSAELGSDGLVVILQYGKEPTASKWLLAVVINDIFVALGGGQPRHRPAKWSTVQRNILWSYKKRSGLNQIYVMDAPMADIEHWAYSVNSQMRQPLQALVAGSIEWTRHVNQETAVATAKMQDSVPTLYKCPVEGCDFSSPHRRYIMGHMRCAYACFLF
eukprot:SAG31_NODE_585_length_13845_cov_25.623163_2_plen_1139_part_00